MNGTAATQKESHSSPTTPSSPPAVIAGPSTPDPPPATDPPPEPSNTPNDALSTVASPSALLDDKPAVNDSTQAQSIEGSALKNEQPTPDKAAEGDAGPLEQLEIKEEGEVLLQHVNGQIELVEHTPDANTTMGPADSVGGLIEDGQEWVTEGEHELKRVKVYELIGSRWVDQGTAFCFGQFQEETNEALLIARAERNYNDIVLSTAIRSNDVYQRQQDTLIVWTEPDGVDYALSFQDPEGCSEVWNFILEVQRHMNSGDEPTNVSSSPILGPDSSVTTASIIRSGHLPTPQLGIIGEIERAIKTLARTQTLKERICEYIQQEDYIKSLIDVMNTAEDLESLENLHALCSIMQTILMLNDHSMYEHILEDDIFFGVVGMLEYDPDFPGHKANYREFLNSTSKFHQPIPIREPSIQRKIHHTYRLQFLKDVVLARALDDSTFNVLNSCIIFNQIDIISHVQQDHVFLKEVVKLFVDEEMLNIGVPGKKHQGMMAQLGHIIGQGQGQGQQGLGSPQPQHQIISLNGEGDNTTPATPASPPVKDLSAMDVDPKPPTTSPKPVNGVLPQQSNGKSPSKQPGTYAFAPPDDLTEAEIELRREVIILIQQLCIMGKNVQLPARMALFRTLVDRGVLFGVQWALGLPEKEPANKPMISAAGEVLAALLDHDLNGVRGHVLKQVVAIEKERDAGKKGADKAETILEMACRILAQSRDLAVQSQVGDALKVWMDIPAMDTGNTAAGEAGPPKPPQRKDDPGTERYMDYFYKDCVHILFKPLNELVEWKNVHEPILHLTREETNRYVYLCDLLYNFVAQHHFRSHFYVMSSNVVSRAASLLKARDKHLRHSAFRIFRLMLKQNNSNIHAQIMKHDVLKPILDLTIRESRRDNLLSCSCQEYFENMRRENMKQMIHFCMTKHEPEIRKLAATPLGGQRFDLLIRRWEMNNEPIPEEPKAEKSTDQRWPQARSLEAEEEDYFNADDDEEEPIPSISQQWSRVAGTSSPMPTLNTGMKRKRRTAIGASSKGYRPPLKAPILGSLVDYDEDDEEASLLDQKPPQGLSKSPSPDAPPSSPKLAHRQVPTSSAGPPPKRMAKEDEDDEDAMLELLVRPKSRAQSPAPVSFTPLRPSEKRRRSDEDDEDEMLERLVKSKKPDLGMQKMVAAGAKSENGDDPPKKIKLKFGVTGLSMANSPPSATPSPSEPSAKDGDTG